MVHGLCSFQIPAIPSAGRDHIRPETVYNASFHYQLLVSLRGVTSLVVLTMLTSIGLVIGCLFVVGIFVFIPISYYACGFYKMRKAITETHTAPPPRRLRLNSPQTPDIGIRRLRSTTDLKRHKLHQRTTRPTETRNCRWRSCHPTPEKAHLPNTMSQTWRKFKGPSRRMFSDRS